MKRLMLCFVIFCSLGSAQESAFQSSKIIHLKAKSDTLGFHTGLDLLIENEFSTIKNKKIAVIFNAGSYDRKNRHAADIFRDEWKGTVVSFIELPESVMPEKNGESPFSNVSSDSGPKQMAVSRDLNNLDASALNGCDVIVWDVQDIGLRESTTVSALAKAIRLSSETRKPLLILDRPNPLTSSIVEAPVSMHSPALNGCPVPFRYGVTIGELALMMNEENWLKTAKPARLFIIPMANYRRTMWYDETGMNWHLPLRNILTVETLLSYTASIFAFQSNISVETGSSFQYEIFGAEWISPDELLAVLNSQKNSGVEFTKTGFLLDGTPDSSRTQTSEERLQTRIRWIIRDRNLYRPLTVGAVTVGLIGQLYPHRFQWTNPAAIDSITGSDEYRFQIRMGMDLRKLEPAWNANLTDYQKTRGKYLLY
ncbi:MAG: exo-beta-N-acetylmuramidase NamZ domain-containing protein [Candidatus Neomarinimicrobiota bacterium]